MACWFSVEAIHADHVDGSQPVLLVALLHRTQCRRACQPTCAPPAVTTDTHRSEFHALATLLHTVRRRIAAATCLAALNRSAIWALGLVLVAAAIFPLRVVGGVGLAAASGAVAFGIFTAWRSHPSAYESACRVDVAMGLHDRLSTAWHFALAEAPDDMMRCQRRDALDHLPQAPASAIVPIGLPAGFRRTAVLALAVTALLAYRATHRPPLAAAVERIAPPAIARAIDAVRRAAPDQYVPEPIVRAETALEVDPSQLSDEGGLLPTFNRDSKASRAPSRGNMGTPFGDGEPGEGVDLPPEDEPPPSTVPPQMSPGAGPPNGARQKRPGGPESEGAQPDHAGQASGAGDSQTPASLSQRLRQALNDLLAKARGDQGNNAQNQRGGGGNSSQPQVPPANAKAIPAPPGSQPTGSPSDKEGESDSKDGGPGATMGMNELGSGNAPGGARDPQPQAIDLTQEPAADTQQKAEVVPLSLTNFQGQASMLTNSQRGTAQTPLRETSSTGASSTRGSEQGEVPLRYRAYVREYFTHPEEARR